MSKTNFSRMAKLAALLVMASAFITGCQTAPSSNSRNSNYVEVFPGTGMPEFPDGSR